MNHTQVLRAILPDVLIDNFDVANFEKTDSRFDIWLDEKNVQMREDKKNSSVISHGFGEYHTIQDFPIRGRAPISMCASASGLTRTLARYSVTSGSCLQTFMEKFADLMIFRHENDLRLQEFAYLCR
jgi:hypothetical protein